MSQVGPSSSHQLVAAAIAFRNARRVFPKDFGFHQTSADTKTEFRNCQRRNNRRPSVAPSVKVQRNGSSDHEWTKENAPTEKWAQERCQCCQRRDCSSTESKLVHTAKHDHYNVGDVETFSLESKKLNKRKNDIIENRIDETARCNCARYCRAREKRAENLLDPSVDTDLFHDAARNGNYKDVLENYGDHNSDLTTCQSPDFHNTMKDWEGRDSESSWTKLKRRSSRKEMSRTSSSYICERQSSRYQHLDLLRPPPDHCNQRDHRCGSRNCRHCRCHHCSESSKICCSSKEDLGHASKNWSRPLSAKCRQKSSTCCELRARSKQSYSPSCCSKDSGIISTLHERDGEDGDEVNPLDRKDSISIFAEKYNIAAEKNDKKYSEKVELTDNENRDDCKSPISDFNEDEKSDDACPCRERIRRSLLKTCKIGYNQMQRENELARLKELRTRLIKAGMRCSMKDTTWRQAF